jgi:hypothetical protein
MPGFIFTAKVNDSLLVLSREATLPIRPFFFIYIRGGLRRRVLLYYGLAPPFIDDITLPH